MSQLAFDGSEGPVVVLHRRQAPLTGAQREILLRLRRDGEIRSVEAGVIVHECDRRPWAPKYRRKYAAADGLEAMKRLVARGLAQRDPEKQGRWLPVGEMPGAYADRATT